MRHFFIIEIPMNIYTINTATRYCSHEDAGTDLGVERDMLDIRTGGGVLKCGVHRARPVMGTG